MGERREACLCKKRLCTRNYLITGRMSKNPPTRDTVASMQHEWARMSPRSQNSLHLHLGQRERDERDDRDEREMMC
jgi:hypothetical protein